MKKRYLLENADDDNDEEDASASEEEIPHPTLATSKGVKFGAPLSKTTSHVVTELHERRRKGGIVPDDGSRRRDDVEGSNDGTLYGLEWLTEVRAREIMLAHDPFYLFASMVAGGYNDTLKTYIKESTISRATRERIAAAKTALAERRRSQHDTRGEQDRAKSLHDEAEKAQKELDDIERAWVDFHNSRECVKRGLDTIEQRRLTLSLPHNAEAPEAKWNFYQRVFDELTRSLVARFGPSGFKSGADLFQTTLQTLNVASFSLGGTAVERLRNDMPHSSTLCLYWTTLKAIFEHSDLLDYVAKHVGEKFPAKSVYAQQPKRYIDDLRSLASHVFNAEPNTPAASNLLLFDEITIYLWRIINLMIENSVEDKTRANLLARPTALPESGRSTKGPSRVVVNNIEVTIEVADEDLQAAIAGQTVFGVDRSKLAELRSKLYNNSDQAATSGVVLALLEPMFQTVWPALFYRKQDLDSGSDPESFAGGYYASAVEMFRGFSGARTAQLTVVGLAIVQTELFKSCLMLKPTSFDARTFAETALRSLDARREDLRKFGADFLRVFGVSSELRRDYERELLDRYLRIDSVLECVAALVIAKKTLGRSLGLTESDFGALKAYNDALKRGSATAVRGSRRDAAFVAVEDAAMRVFVNANVIDDDGDIQEDSAYLIPLPDLFRRSQLLFIDAVLATSRAKEYVHQHVGPLEERIAALRQREREINARIDTFLKKTLADERDELESILREGAGGNPENALSPINTGVLFFTEVYLNALKEAYIDIENYLPCLAATYSSDALITSTRYQSRYSSLVSSKLRGVDARNSKVPRYDRTEKRSRVQEASAIESLRQWADKDTGLRHRPGGCDCPGRGGGLRYNGTPRLAESFAPYPLAPSLSVSRGAF